MPKTDADSTATLRAITHARGGITIDERLDSIDETLTKISRYMSDGETLFATHSLRLRAVEVITYGACSLGLVAIAGALIALVVKARP